ncbi:hypothetical protein ACFL6I_15225 [candidate division KSB1 bacterium]
MKREEGIFPSEWIAGLLVGDSFMANFFAFVAGALMHFATLANGNVLRINFWSYCQIK